MKPIFSFFRAMAILAVISGIFLSVFGGITTVAKSAGQACSLMLPESEAKYKVIDISHHVNDNLKAPIDWKTVAGNVDAVYIKATESNDPKYTDKCLDLNATSALDAGIKIGFFHYLWPHATTADAAAQADLFYNTIKKYNYSCLPVLDVEEANGMTSTQIVTDVKAFADEFKKLSGQDIIIYTFVNFTGSYLDSSLSCYKLWIAYYNNASEPPDTNVWHSWVMWQTGTATIPGIGEVDCDTATDNIFISSDDNSGSTSGYAIITDSNSYSSDQNGKYFNITLSQGVGAANLSCAQFLVITTLDTGESTVGLYPAGINTPLRVNASENAVRSTVYLIEGSFDGENIPKTYTLSQVFGD